MNVPSFGIFQTTSGNIRKATTICKLAFKAFNSAKKRSSFKFVGCNKVRLWAKAYSFTAEYFIFWPRPTGLSAAVITPTTGLDSRKVYGYY